MICFLPHLLLISSGGFRLPPPPPYVINLFPENPKLFKLLLCLSGNSLFMGRFPPLKLPLFPSGFLRCLAPCLSLEPCLSGRSSFHFRQLKNIPLFSFPGVSNPVPARPLFLVEHPSDEYPPLPCRVPFPFRAVIITNHHPGLAFCTPPKTILFPGSLPTFSLPSYYDEVKNSGPPHALSRPKDAPQDEPSRTPNR